MIDDFMWGYSAGPMNIPTPAPTHSGASREDVHQLNTRIDKLTLICMSMWSLIRQETKLTEEDLLRRMKDIDLMDGTEDDKVTRQVAKCGSCGRVMNQRHTHCLYCGHEKLIISAFDTIT